MVTGHLKRPSGNTPSEREIHVRKVEISFKRLSRDMGPRNWTREDLYDRQN